MSNITIESSNPHDTPVEIEEKLEKAYTAVKNNREANHRDFNDRYLQSKKVTADMVVTKVFKNMISEINTVLNK
jgi:hypothetical protein